MNTSQMPYKKKKKKKKKKVEQTQHPHICKNPDRKTAP